MKIVYNIVAKILLLLIRKSKTTIDDDLLQEIINEAQNGKTNS